MRTLFIVNNPKNWDLDVPGIEVISAKAYLTRSEFSDLRAVKVFNLCKSYRYQSNGYYVSLLAAARGHKPIPSVMTIQDMKSQTMIRFVSEDLDDLIQKSLAPLQSGNFTLSIYFGQNLAKRYQNLSQHLFKLFPAPCLRAIFVFNKKWQLQNIEPIAADDIPKDHYYFVEEAAKEYFMGKVTSVPRKSNARYDMAILYNRNDLTPPSDEKSLQKFMRAAESVGFDVEVIDKDDYGRIAEFDALFIRETTSVNHHTYRFARRATAEGLVVIDDPESILKCTNKVYLAEMLDRYKIPAPKTVILHRDNKEEAIRELGFPIVLKQPDSSFSLGVVKVDDEAQFTTEVDRLLEKSELIIAQEFVPTPYDWRVGIIDHQPLYVCKYYMARKHWQIVKKEDGTGKLLYGKTDSFPVEQAPEKVVRIAQKAANLIGDGLYGVDIKELDGKFYVIEINDNPSIDHSVEDMILKDELYRRIMRVFLKRIERRKEGLV